LKCLDIQQGIADLLLALPQGTSMIGGLVKETSLIADNQDGQHQPTTMTEIPRGPVLPFLRVHHTIALFIAVGSILAILIIGLALKSWISQRVSKVDQPFVGNINTHSNPTIMLMVVDVSSSLSKSQIQEVAMNANSILGNLPASTKFAIYPLQPNWNRPIAMETGETEKPSTIDRRLLEENNRREMILRTAEDFRRRPEGKVSCLVDVLPFAERYFSQYDPNRYEFELVFLSDMIENCSSTLLGRKVDLTIGYPLDGVESRLNVRDRIDLSNVNVTMIIPTSSDFSGGTTRRNPRFEDLERFWKRLFASCGFSDLRLNDKQHFVFSTFLPDRFKAKSQDE